MEGLGNRGRGDKIFGFEFTGHPQDNFAKMYLPFLTL